MIKPIETYYNGYRFRSRLEARVAIFLDCLNMEYLYEPEGIEFPDGTMYLPDFYLPESKTFLEVKGIMADQDLRKIKMLAKQSDKYVAIIYPDFSFQASDMWEDGGSITSKGESWLIQCLECKKYSFMGNGASWGCRSCGYYDGDSGFIVEMAGDWTDCSQSYTERPHGEVKAAIETAKQARFEHGEMPITTRRI
jgi:hypothetical protein